MAAHVCVEPGCHTLTTNTRCPTHQRQHQNTTRRRYRRNNYGPTWPATRRRQLAQHPHCAHCATQGRRTPATVVDHIIPIHHFDNTRRAHHPDNLQSLCKPCHDRKTATNDSAFGRPPRVG